MHVDMPCFNFKRIHIANSTTTINLSKDHSLQSTMIFQFHDMIIFLKRFWINLTCISHPLVNGHKSCIQFWDYGHPPCLVCNTPTNQSWHNHCKLFGDLIKVVIAYLNFIKLHNCFIKINFLSEVKKIGCWRASSAFSKNKLVIYNFAISRSNIFICTYDRLPEILRKETKNICFVILACSRTKLARD